MSQAGATKPSRGAGRPAIGRRVIVTLTDAQIVTAGQLGNGIIAAGVRQALDRAEAYAQRQNSGAKKSAPKASAATPPSTSAPRP